MLALLISLLWLSVLARGDFPIFERDNQASFNGCINQLHDSDLVEVTQSSKNYDNVTRAFNMRTTYEPNAVLYPTTPEEVAQVVGCAFHSNLSISARSGGHSYAGYSLAGDVVIDLSKLNSIDLSPNGTAKVQTGNLLGDVATTLWNNNKRALPHGSCPYVGTGGHASLGGYGFFSRKAGLLLDTIKEAEVVLANGTLVHASTVDNPDLFWALRGAGPSFGVVTSWTFQTLEAPETVIDFTINFGALTTDEFTSALVSYQNFAVTAPPEISVQTVVGPNGKGGVFLSFQGDYYGTNDEFHSVVDPWMKTLPASRNLTSSELDWIDALVAKDGDLSTSAPEKGDTFYAKSLLVTEPSSNQSLSNWVNFMFGKGVTSNINWFGEIDMWGGAIANVSSSDTAFSFRNAILGYQLYSSSPNGLPPYPQNQFEFVNEWWQSIAGNVTAAPAYTNYIDPLLSADVWPTSYYNGSFERLIQIKNSVDPYNIFRFNQSIPLVNSQSSHQSGSGNNNSSSKSGGASRLMITNGVVVLILAVVFRFMLS